MGSKESVGERRDASLRQLRIGLIAPPWLAVPPTGYGGTEVVLDILARGLVTAGHEVTLFTTGDSTSPVKREFVLDVAPGIDVGGSPIEVHHVAHAYRALAAMDVIHDHTAIGPFYAANRIDRCVVTTNHNPFAGQFRTLFGLVAGQVPIIAISEHHARSASPLPIESVIYHGVVPEEFPLGSGSGGYALFLGRMSPAKGAHRALSIARAAGVRLVLAGKMHTDAEIAYFEAEIRPHLGPGAEYVGEVGGREKLALLGEASFLLNPIAWDEPFGMVMVEALACGTPVLALCFGAAPEIVTDGLTGFVTTTTEDLVAAICRVGELDRSACRRAVEERFSAARMTEAHVALYRRLYSRHLSR
jgi:glycosyltransferase involved in cell wall biosynthesis